MRMAVTMAECGVDTVNLADTVGYANPAQVRRLFTRLRQALGAGAAARICTIRAGRGSPTWWRRSMPA